MHKTKAKIAVEKTFKVNKKPINLNNLFLEVKKVLPKIAYSTVYRIVLKLEQENKITKIDWRDRGSFYEWVNNSHHHHIICEKCDNVSDIDDKTLSFSDQKLKQKTGFLAKTHSIEIYGVCKPCQMENL